MSLITGLDGRNCAMRVSYSLNREDGLQGACMQAMNINKIEKNKQIVVSPKLDPKMLESMPLRCDNAKNDRAKSPIVPSTIIVLSPKAVSAHPRSFVIPALASTSVSGRFHVTIRLVLGLRRRVRVASLPPELALVYTVLGCRNFRPRLRA